MKIQPSFNFEKSVYLQENPLQVVLGVDEVGRGCLAGPVVAGAVEVPATFFLAPSCDLPEWLKFVTDSKLISEAKRPSLAADIQAHCLWGIGAATVEEIDQINILQASHLAMFRAVEELLKKKKSTKNNQNDARLNSNKTLSILIDGNIIPKALKQEYYCKSIIKGDQKSYSIACASIIAKVFRDQLMAGLDSQYPEYFFSKHKGYSTKIHQDALKKYGITPFHRKTFAPVTALLNSN